MNKLMTTFFAGVLIFATSLSAIAQKATPYGKKFKTNTAYSATELSSRMGDKDKLENVVISGEIAQVCQAEGCWMKLKNETGADIFVKFKDHSFMIPKDLAGRKAYVNGTAIRKTVSVEDQKHYAEDEGLAPEEIAKITQPKVELRVDATGVVIE
ncbi:MAG TPA: DUF4920 domain-containing protein [Flavipsychrobacter sp.]|nr:DUF4920 domain-containing protein [Flavipsychrobacter sp.]